MAMFPDSGVPPADAKNSLLDVNTTANCDELWYSTSRCTPRFDPAAANAMLSEVLNAVMCAGIPYDCTKLNNLCLAIAYTIQNGHAICLPLSGGPFDYAGNLTPPLLAYPTDCCMMVNAIPNIRNQGAVRINVNGLGLVSVIRNDGQALQAGDLMPTIPVTLIYCSGRFVVVGMLPSQVPIMVDAIDLWVRTDGNDATADGSANSPDKAFRTIAAAWASSKRYLARPTMVLTIRLGIPGTYEGTFIGPFAGRVVLMGDQGNRQVYRIAMANLAGNMQAILVTPNTNLYITGVTLMIDQGGGAQALAVHGRCVMDRVRFEAMTSNTLSSFITVFNGGDVGYTNDNDLEGNGQTIGAAVNVSSGYFGSTASTNLRFSNFRATTAGFISTNIGIVQFGGGAVITNANTLGPRYTVNMNSIIQSGGQQMPGDTAGNADAATNGVYI